MKDFFDQAKRKSEEFQRNHRGSFDQFKSGVNNMKNKYENSDFAKKFEYEKQNINQSQNQFSEGYNHRDKYNADPKDLKKKLYDVGYTARVYATAFKKVVDEQNIPDKLKKFGENVQNKAQQQKQQQNNRYNNNSYNNYNYNNQSNYGQQGQQYFNSLKDRFGNFNFSKITSYRPTYYLKVMNWMRYNKVLAVKLLMGAVFVYGIGAAIPRAFTQYMLEKKKVEQPINDPQYQDYLLYKRQKEREEIEQKARQLGINNLDFDMDKLKQNKNGAIDL